MISKAQVKLIRSLQQKKYRKLYGLFIAEGTKTISEILNASKLKPEKLYATSAWLNNHAQIYAKLSKAQIEEVNELELSQISVLTTPQEALLTVRIPETNDIILPQSKKLSLAVESIRDPGNMGTILRLADWYGLERIYCSPDCADVFSPKVVQATMGSIGRVEAIETELAELLNNSPVPSYAAVLGGEINIHELNSFKEGILLIGNEAGGLSEALQNVAAHTISIPRYGQAESLNAAIATGILLDNTSRLINRP